MYSSSEVSPLLVFLKDHKYKNLHTRKNKQVKNKKVLKHLHGMKLKSAKIISGYFCGCLSNSKLAEIEYEIDHTGTVKVKATIGITKPQALKCIDDERKTVMKRVISAPIRWSPKYLKNNFYLRRSVNTTVTSAANKAVKNGILSSKFVKIMASWNLRNGYGITSRFIQLD